MRGIPLKERSIEHNFNKVTEPEAYCIEKDLQIYWRKGEEYYINRDSFNSWVDNQDLV